MSVNEKMTAIANAIRDNHPGITTMLPLDVMPDAINNAAARQYAEGKAEGKAEGYQEGYEAGNQAEYDAFWDTFQQNGNRTQYVAAFGCGWNKNNFRPKYSLRPKNAYFMFFNNVGEYIDLGEVAEDFFDNLGIELDYSNATQTNYGVSNLHAKRFKKIDFSNSKNTQNAFYTHNYPNANSIEVIDNFVSSEITTYHSSTFQHAVFLREIRITGVIATNGFNVQYSPNLSRDSVVSIISALSTTTTGLSITLSLTAVNNAFETSNGAADGSSSEEWAALVAAKSNWTINLI